MSTIGVTYTCGRCQAIKRVVKVPERTILHDPESWMLNVMARALSDDHVRFSPMCRNTSMKLVLVPLPDEGRALGTKPSAPSPKELT